MLNIFSAFYDTSLARPRIGRRTAGTQDFSKALASEGTGVAVKSAFAEPSF